MRKQFSILLFLFFVSIMCRAQEGIVADSVSVDSSTTVKSVVSEPESEKKKKSGPVRNFFRKGYPNPTKAMVLSFVIPGSGQLYNKKYWKIPIVLGAYGLMIYFIDFSSGQYKFYKQEYINCVDDNPGTVSLLKTQKGWGEDDIKSERDLYRKRMELSYVGLAAVALLSGVDAFVDAHLKGFDVSEDLTMRVKPKVDFVPFEGSSMGIGFSFQLKNNSSLQPKVFKF